MRRACYMPSLSLSTAFVYALFRAAYFVFRFMPCQSFFYHACLTVQPETRTTGSDAHQTICFRMAARLECEPGYCHKGIIYDVARDTAIYTTRGRKLRFVGRCAGQVCAACAPRFASLYRRCACCHRQRYAAKQTAQHASFRALRKMPMRLCLFRSL